jgi:hypothetical protein
MNVMAMRLNSVPAAVAVNVCKELVVFYSLDGKVSPHGYHTAVVHEADSKGCQQCTSKHVVQV